GGHDQGPDSSRQFLGGAGQMPQRQAQAGCPFPRPQIKSPAEAGRDGHSTAYSAPPGGGGSRGGGQLALIRTLPPRGPPVCDGHHILPHFGPASRPPARALIPATVPANPLVEFAIL